MIIANLITKLSSIFGQIIRHLLSQLSLKSAEICKNFYQVLFIINLESKDGVIAVHCNHGKGRTGTSIIAFMLYARKFLNA